MSSATRLRISATGALPGRKPGTRASFENSLATLSIFLVTTSAGISRSSSRRQVAAAVQVDSAIVYEFLFDFECVQRVRSRFVMPGGDSLRYLYKVRVFASHLIYMAHHRLSLVTTVCATVCNSKSLSFREA